MKESTPLGLNKTGIQMSPFDSSLMQSPPPSTVPATPGDSSAIALMRGDYIREAEPLGSVPIPTTASGALATGIALLTGNTPQIFMDKLGERLAFERTGTRLYDALITKCEAAPDEIVKGMTIAELRQIRDDEARHFAMLADAIESFGGDPTAQTPSADLVGVESIGLVQIVTDPRTTVAQSLHAILSAELADQSGWELLIALSDEHGQTVMSGEFSTALDEERAHLKQVKTWYEDATLGTRYPEMARDPDVSARPH